MAQLGMKFVILKVLLALCLALPPFAYAQSKKTSPASGGFDLSGKQPINIEAGRLEVNDKANSATFVGKVLAVQGDTILKCEKLEVFYDQAAKGQNAAAPVDGATNPASDNQRSIKRLEAHTNVVFISKDQTATGQRGTYDAKQNLVTIWGGVTLTQGENVVTGEKMTLNTLTNVANVETGKGGRVRALFIPGTEKQAEAGEKPKAKKTNKSKAD